MRIGFAADHAGAALKDELIRRIREAGADHELLDLGGDGSDPNDDYPDFAQRLGEAVRGGLSDRGILICGSGVGAAIAACKIRGSVPSGNTIRFGCLCSLSIRLPMKRMWFSP